VEEVRPCSRTGRARHGRRTAPVLRDGKAWTAHWSRPRANGGTTFTTADGRPMTFAPGQVWIVLAHR